MNRVPATGRVNDLRSLPFFNKKSDIHTPCIPAPITTTEDFEPSSIINDYI